MKNDPNSWLSAFVFTGTLLLFVAGIIGAMAIHPIMLVLCVAAVWALAMLDRV